MKINLVAVGKIKEKYFSDAIAEYEKRLGRFCSFCLTEIAEAAPSKSVAEQIADENARLLEKCKGFVVAFDSRGEELTSEKIAELLDKQSTSGNGEFTFLIGGSNGLSNELKARVNFVLSFGRQTFPHQLFRVMAIEQIYRAMTINAGLPYHK